MKILVADFLFVKAHKNFNENVIKALTNFADVDVINVNDFYNKQINHENFVNFKMRLLKDGTIKTRINSFCIMCRFFFYFLKNGKKYDAVFCLAFETLTTLFANLFFCISKDRFFLFHHKNIDELEKPLKKKIFQSYQRKFTHIVFEKEFAQQLKQITGLKDSFVKVVPHPIFCPYLKKEDDYDCVGLCNSNDAKFIEDLYAALNAPSYSKLFFVVRSPQKLPPSVSKFVTINSFLTNEQYWNYILSAKSIFVALPQSYRFRLSGSIYDAFASRKKVFTSSNFHASLYGNLYPGLCEYVSSAKELVDKVLNFDPNYENHEFDHFINDHSIDSLSKRLSELVENL